MIGAPERIRTPNLLIRSQVLYPVELRAHIGYKRYSDLTSVSTCLIARPWINGKEKKRQNGKNIKKL